MKYDWFKELHREMREGVKRLGNARIGLQIRIVARSWLETPWSPGVFLSLPLGDLLSSLTSFVSSCWFVSAATWREGDLAHRPHCPLGRGPLFIFV